MNVLYFNIFSKNIFYISVYYEKIFPPSIETSLDCIVNACSCTLSDHYDDIYYSVKCLVKSKVIYMHATNKPFIVKDPIELFRFLCPWSLSVNIQSSLGILGQLKQNLAGTFIGWFYAECVYLLWVFFVLIRNSAWSPGLIG